MKRKVYNDILKWKNELFDNYLENLDYLFTYLSEYYSVKLYERESLFIFDEIQFCPRARGAIKHLVADGRYYNYSYKRFKRRRWNIIYSCLYDRIIIIHIKLHLHKAGISCIRKLTIANW